MAELIPLEYRFEILRTKLIGRWATTVVLALAVCGGSLAYAYAWKQKQSQAFNQLSDECRAKSVLIAQAKELQSRRLELAARMLKMQELMEDKTLLSLLQNVSQAFSANDCLEYISVMAHGQARSGPGEGDDNKYAVHITGITKSDTTHADLLNRLTEIGMKSNPPVATTPESLHREPLLDGNVMRFEILCDKPEISRG